MKVKNAWRYKFIACMTAVAMVFSSLSIPAVSVYADENNAAMETVAEDITPEEAVEDVIEEAAISETEADDAADEEAVAAPAEDDEEAAIVPVEDDEEAVATEVTTETDTDEDEETVTVLLEEEEDTVAADLAEEDIAVAAEQLSVVFGDPEYEYMPGAKIGYTYSNAQVTGTNTFNNIFIKVDQGTVDTALVGSDSYKIYQDTDKKLLAICYKTVPTNAEIQSLFRNNIKFTVDRRKKQDICLVTTNDKEMTVEADSIVKRNGHYYALVKPAAPVTWREAYNDAKENRFMGMNGYLATVTDNEEADFLFKNVAKGETNTALNAWIGSARVISSPAYFGFDEKKIAPLDMDDVDKAEDYTKAFKWTCGPEKGTPIGGGVVLHRNDGMHNLQADYSYMYGSMAYEENHGSSGSRLSFSVKDETKLSYYFVEFGGYNAAEDPGIALVSFGSSSEDPWRADLSSGIHTLTALNLPDVVEVARKFKPDEEPTVNDTYDAENSKVRVTIGEDGIVNIKLKEDVDGPVSLEDDMGNVVIDLNGHKIEGKPGDESTAGLTGISIEKSPNGGDTGIDLTIKNTAKNPGVVKGGDALKGSGNSGGDAIDMANAKATLTVGENVKVIGGNGASGKDTTGNGGKGGAGVDNDNSTRKNLVTNAGEITGGKGGDSVSGTGGEGGDGVTGNVSNNKPSGTINGGDGGNSVNGNGGAGGDGVDKDVIKNEGNINGGNGGNATGGKGNGGAGGDGVDGKVTENTPSGKITGGNGGNTTDGTGGTGGNGVDGSVATNNGTINGGNGGSATGGTGKGGTGGKGVTGVVGGGNGTVSDGNGGMTKEEAELYKKSEPLETVENALKALNADKGDLLGSDFAVFRLRAYAQNKAIKLKWKKQAGADGYIIYGNLCGKQYPMTKKVKEIQNGNKTQYTVKNLKKGRYYRYTVVAYKKFGNKKRVIATAIIVHSTTNGGNRTNPSAIVVKSGKSMTVNVGKTQNIKATYTKKVKKKVSRHIAIVRFESSNPAVATVDRRGKVKGVAPGKATIYVYGQNGVYKTVNVTVKK